MTDTAHDQHGFPFGFTEEDDRPKQRREPTLPAPPAVAGNARTAQAPNDAAFRSDAAAPAAPVATSAAVAPTAVMEVPAALTAEERKLAAERAARREAREAALAAPDVRATATPEPVVVTRRSTDRFLGAFSLFLVRLVVAAIMAVHGLAYVTDPVGAERLFATTVIPEPAIMSAVTGYASLAIAVALVFGLLTRIAGLGVLLIAGGALAFVLWGNWSPFVAGRAGFVGEFELLLAVVGLLLLCVGGGGFSLDRSFRKSRENR